MIRWLGPLGRVWAPAIIPLHGFVFCMVVSLGFVLCYITFTLIFGLIVRIIICFIYVVVKRTL